MCIAHTLGILFPPAHMPFNQHPKRSSQARTNTLAGTSISDLLGTILGGAVGFINGFNYGFVSSTCWDMTSTTMVKNNPLKIVELHPT